MKQLKRILCTLLVSCIVATMLPATAHANAAETTWQGHRYQVFENKASTWAEAENYCQSLGGHLATISCQEENDFIYQVMVNAGYTNAYFGLTDHDKEGTWIWVTGEPVIYTNWHSGEPNSENADEDHAMFYYKYKDGTWNDGNFEYTIGNKGSAFICEWDPIPDNESISGVAETISNEMVLRARILTESDRFLFCRNWDSPVRVAAQQLSPLPASAWYVLENLLDAYYQGIKNGNTSIVGMSKITAVEFYEYLLLKLLDCEELNYLSLTEPFELVNDLSNGKIDTALLKELASKGFKAGTKITDVNKSDIKEFCIAMCGTDDGWDVGWMDSILISGKTIDEFVSEFVTLYQLIMVSDARAAAIRLIGESTDNTALRTAANNVCSSIQQAKKEGISYCLSGGLEESIDSITSWVLNKIVDVLCDIHPASKLWKATAESTTFLMDTVFLTDDVSADTLYILSMSNIEKATLAAISQSELEFINQESVQNAQRLVALAECYQQELLVGCDLVENLVNHCERGNLNWNGILSLLGMTVDIESAIKFFFGDPNSSYAQMRKALQSIRTSIKNINFYSGVDILSVLREVKSTTPSTWAVSEVQTAIKYNLLPEEMQNNYQNNITRLEFCALLECMIEEKTGKAVSTLIKESGGPRIHRLFDDALFMYVNDMAQLKIISGVDENHFNPLGEITRQEAATILYRTAQILDYDISASGTSYAGIADWARPGIDFVMTHGIMNGTGNDFDPNGKYTKEQAVLTILRLYKLIGNTGLTNTLTENNSISVDNIIGQWTIDAERTMNVNRQSLRSIFGSSIRYGYKMTFGPDTAFSYAIAAGVGGTGNFSVSENIIEVSYISYDTKQSELLTLYTFYEENKLFIVMEVNNARIFWIHQ